MSPKCKGFVINERQWVLGRLVESSMYREPQRRMHGKAVWSVSSSGAPVGGSVAYW